MHVLESTLVSVSVAVLYICIRQHYGAIQMIWYKVQNNVFSRISRPIVPIFYRYVMSDIKNMYMKLRSDSESCSPRSEATQANMSESLSRAMFRMASPNFT